MLKNVKGMMAQNAEGGEQMQLRHAPRGSHSSQGGVENVVQLIRKGFNVQKLALERKLGRKFQKKSKEPILTWLPRHVAFLRNNTMKGRDNKTAFETVKLVAYSSPILEFGEKVRARLPGDKEKGKDAGWVEGIWSGRTNSSDEHIILTPEKVVYARAIKAVEEKERWDADFIDKIRWTPWETSLPKGNRPEGDVQIHLRNPPRGWTPTPGCAACERGGQAWHNKTCKLRQAAMRQGASARRSTNSTKEKSAQQNTGGGEESDVNRARSTTANEAADETKAPDIEIDDDVGMDPAWLENDNPDIFPRVHIGGSSSSENPAEAKRRFQQSFADIARKVRLRARGPDSRFHKSLVESSNMDTEHSTESDAKRLKGTIQEMSGEVNALRQVNEEIEKAVRDFTDEEHCSNKWEEIGRLDEYDGFNIWNRNEVHCELTSLVLGCRNAQWLLEV